MIDITKTNKAIDCNVNYCKYYYQNKCTLDKILVSKNGKDKHIKEETMCASYKEE